VIFGKKICAISLLCGQVKKIWPNLRKCGQISGNVAKLKKSRKKICAISLLCGQDKKKRPNLRKCRKKICAISHFLRNWPHSNMLHNIWGGASSHKSEELRKFFCDESVKLRKFFCDESAKLRKFFCDFFWICAISLLCGQVKKIWPNLRKCGQISGNVAKLKKSRKKICAISLLCGQVTNSIFLIFLLSGAISWGLWRFFLGFIL
jgi:hypothetical protein